MASDDKSFWLLTADPEPENAALEGDLDVDVAVVGGGVCGISAALHLKVKSPSLRVAVLESETIGFGASGRNAGMVATLMGLTPGTTRRRFGKAHAGEVYQFGYRAVESIAELVDSHGIDCDYEKPGLLTVATNKGRAKRLQHEIRLAEEVGVVRLEWLDARAARAQVDSPTYLGARSDPQCALVNPVKLVRGMRDAAVKAGAEVYERTPVVKLKEGRRRLKLDTPRGSVRADRVVFATNAYSGLFPQLKHKQLPLFTYVVLTEPLNQRQLGSIRWHNRQAIDDAAMLKHYYRLTADDRLLFGGADISYYFGGALHRDLNPSVFRRLERDMKRTFPALSDAQVSYRWGGPISATLDFFPAVGSLGGDKRITYSLGCMGHGLAMMYMVGQIHRDLVLERESELTEMFFVNRRLIPVPPDPLCFVMASAVRAMMKGRDAWETCRRSNVGRRTPAQ